MTTEQVNYYLEEANNAYDTFTVNGPLFGKKQGDPNEAGSPPTWRVAAEPQWLPERYKTELEQLGEDIYALGNALPNLPNEDKKKLGIYLSYATPPTFRIDTILTKDGLKVNEIQIADGADALMVVEQLAYGLQTLDTSTANALASLFTERFPDQENIRIALVRETRESNYITNSQRMAEMLNKVSAGKIQMDILFRDELPQDLPSYTGIINYAYLSPEKYQQLGIKPEQLISTGDYAALGNKGVFALLFEESKKDFWTQNLGEARYQRLLQAFIPSWFIETQDEVIQARASGKTVVKGYAVKNESDLRLLDSGKSVFGPWMDNWDGLQEMAEQGMRFIGQKMETPLRLKTLLRKDKGRKLERKLRYNRICVKFVTTQGKTRVTAAEATLGENIKPTGRDTSFVPVQFTQRRKDLGPFEYIGY